MKISVEQLRKIISEELEAVQQAGAAAIGSEQESAKKKVEFKQQAAAQLQTILNTFQSAEEIAAFMKAVEVAGIKIMNQRKQAAPTAGAPPE